MKLETIKRNNKKKVIIGSMIVLSVVGCITLTTTRAKYRNVQSLKLASGTVKINSYDFKIMAMKQSEDGVNYTDINTMPESGYIINEEKSYCTTDNKTQVKGKLKTNSDGEHVFSKLNKNDKCYIWFDIKPLTSKDTIIRLNVQNIKTGSPDFTQVATEAETEENNGVFEVDDPMYIKDSNLNSKSYYWRGAATTNHVIFDDKCWRIIRINGDGSIRLIYNGAVQSENTCKGNEAWEGNIVLKGVKYNDKNDNNSYVGWSYIVGFQRPNSTNPQISGSNSILKEQLENNWYTNNISEKAKTLITIGKFCNDRSVKNNEIWVQNGSVRQDYAAEARTFETMTPTLGCPTGDVYELSVGMITADEVQFAGFAPGDGNKKFYLYNGQFYWTMTPFYWYYINEYTPKAAIFALDTNGGFGASSVVNNYLGVRPVINLRSDVTFNSGSDGTQNNPYIVQ